MEQPTSTHGTFVHPSLPRVGTMTGRVKEGPSGPVFLPDEAFHDRLFDLYGLEPEEGLFLEQGTFTPAG
jgi:hypothetical protein